MDASKLPPLDPETRRLRLKAIGCARGEDQTAIVKSRETGIMPQIWHDRVSRGHNYGRRPAAAQKSIDSLFDRLNRAGITYAIGPHPVTGNDYLAVSPTEIREIIATNAKLQSRGAINREIQAWPEGREGTWQQRSALSEASPLYRANFRSATEAWLTSTHEDRVRDLNHRLAAWRCEELMEIHANGRFPKPRDPANPNLEPEILSMISEVISGRLDGSLVAPRWEPNEIAVAS